MYKSGSFVHHHQNMFSNVSTNPKLKFDPTTFFLKETTPGLTVKPRIYLQALVLPHQGVSEANSKMVGECWRPQTGLHGGKLFVFIFFLPADSSAVTKQSGGFNLESILANSCVSLISKLYLTAKQSRKQIYKTLIQIFLLILVL